jgi:acetoin utilization deacetylase AcuC-like enzyme
VSARIVYSVRYRVDIGPHVFPTRKYDLVYDALGHPPALDSPAATWEELALVHTTEYLQKLRTGTISEDDIAQLELPWSAEMVEGFRVMVGGTIQAALFACGLNDNNSTQRSERALNVACHIGGGLHHAFPNHGEGFCPFNDVAVAARLLQHRGIDRIAIVDLDVHHGNGTAFVFESDPAVFTFSMHQQHNYPMWKPRGSLDIGLPDGADDATYLRALERALPEVVAHRPRCMFYLAGADPYEDDQLGNLRLTKEGLRRRDRLVLDTFRMARVPIVVTLAGGYARRVEDTVAIHVATVEEAMDAAAASGRPTAPPRADRDRQASSGEG